MPKKGSPINITNINTKGATLTVDMLIDTKAQYATRLFPLNYIQMYPATVEEAIETLPQPETVGELRKVVVYAPAPMRGGDWHIVAFSSMIDPERKLSWAYDHMELAR